MLFEGLHLVSPADISALHFHPVSLCSEGGRDSTILLIKHVQNRKTAGLLDCAIRFNEIDSVSDKIFFLKEDLESVFHSLDTNSQQVLLRTAERIRAFADAQKNSLQELTVNIQAGHVAAPVAVAGCYAPGGR